jgi:hypothetical protein
MKRFLLAPGALILLAALVPAPASAQEIQLGATSTPLIAPVCPAGVTQTNCTIVLTQVTALETIRDGIAYPTTVKKAGEIVGFSLGLSSISANKTTLRGIIKYLDSTYGPQPTCGTTPTAAVCAAQAQLTVLRPVGKKSLRQWAVAAQTPAYSLQPYLGQVVQFPLITPLPVVPGETVALTIPTWAPVLSFNLPTAKFAYRQSRKANCTHPAASIQAQLVIGNMARYGCDYAGTRVEYSATEITTPTQTPGYIR